MPTKFTLPESFSNTHYYVPNMHEMNSWYLMSECASLCSKEILISINIYAKLKKSYRFFIFRLKKEVEMKILAECLTKLVVYNKNDIHQHKACLYCYVTVHTTLFIKHKLISNSFGFPSPVNVISNHMPNQWIKA